MTRTRARLLVAATVVACLATTGIATQSDAAPVANQVNAPDSDVVVVDNTHGLTKYFADGSAPRVLSNTLCEALATDAAQNLYYVNQDGDPTLREVPADGGPEVTLATLRGDVFSGIAVDHQGNVYVSESYSELAIFKVPAGGGTPTVYADEQTFRSLGFDSHDNLYATGYQNVVKIPAGGGAGTIVATVTQTPSALAVQPDGGFYVGDFHGDPVTHYDSNGGGATPVPGLDIQVRALALDRAGNLYATSDSPNLTELPVGGTARVIDAGTDGAGAVVALEKPLSTPPGPPSPGGSAPPAPGPLALATAGVPHLRGHRMSIDVTGFTPGETYQVKISGVVVGHGTADAKGEIHRKVRVPLRAHRPRAKLVVKGSEHRVHQLIRIRDGIAKP